MSSKSREPFKTTFIVQNYGSEKNANERKSSGRQVPRKFSAKSRRVQSKVRPKSEKSAKKIVETPALEQKEENRIEPAEEENVTLTKSTGDEVRAALVNVQELNDGKTILDDEHRATLDLLEKIRHSTAGIPVGPMPLSQQVFLCSISHCRTSKSISVTFFIDAEL